MPTDRRRAAARRRAWGRGPMILRFEPLEGRQLLSTSGTTTPLPDLAGASFDTLHNLDWGDSFHARGSVINNGNAAVTTPFHVDFYASPTPGLTATTAVFLGEATVPAGLQPGQKAPIDQVISLPTTPISGVDSNNTIYVEMVTDPQGAVAESSKTNNYGLGQGYDLSMVTIVPHQPANLVPASIGVYPDQAQWGSTVKVTFQTRNDGAGDAPATRGRVVLTPLGTAPGGSGDVTVGNLSIPAVPAGQTAVVNGDITLPAVPPAAFSGVSQYILSVVQDSDFAINPIAPHSATGGIGFDMANVSIALPANPSASLGPKPDLTPVSVLAPMLPINFGQTFQVTTSIHNVGNLDSGPYRVRFLLVGSNGDLSQGLFLGDATVGGLKAGYGQDLVQTIKFPSKLPAGVTLGNQARIAVEVDPENTIDESSKTNNAALSGVVSLGIVGVDGVTTSVTQSANSASTTAAAKAAAAAAKAKTPSTGTLKSTGTAPLTNAVNPRATAPRAKRHARLPKHTLEHNLKVFPKRVSNYVHKMFKHI